MYQLLLGKYYIMKHPKSQWLKPTAVRYCSSSCRSVLRLGGFLLVSLLPPWLAQWLVEAQDREALSGKCFSCGSCLPTSHWLKQVTGPRVRVGNYLLPKCRDRHGKGEKYEPLNGPHGRKGRRPEGESFPTKCLYFWRI